MVHVGVKQRALLKQSTAHGLKSTAQVHLESVHLHLTSQTVHRQSRAQGAKWLYLVP